MALKHDWIMDKDSPKVVFESDEYPYCFYIECMRCGYTFCNNGCDGDVMNEDCSSSQATLFE